MTIYDDDYKDVKLLLPLKWQFILKDRKINKETAVQYLKDKIGQIK